METIVIRLITDKPVKKTAYQVKGVFMKQYPNSSVIPMLDGHISGEIFISTCSS